jgi:RNA polymerase sigma-B factor
MPSTRELAKQLELDEQEVRDAQVAYVAFDAVSLDAPVSSHEDLEQQPRSEAIGGIDEGYALAEERVTVGRAVRKLPLEERRVLRMRFVEDRTQSEIARRIGVSQMQVSRILRRTLDRLRASVDRPSVDRPTDSRRLPAAARRVSKRR